MAARLTHDTNLTEGSVTKKLLLYALPLVGTSMLQAIYSITDIIVVGHFVGGSGISAVNNASLITHLLTQIIIGFTVGGNVLIGQFFGAGDEDNRKKASGTLFTICLAAGLLVSAVFFFLARPFLAALGAPALEEAASYLRICALGLFSVFGYNALSSILRAMGNSRMPLYFIIASTAINVGLDLLFVAGLGMGVAGAAIATVTAQCVAFLAALFYVLKNRRHYGLAARKPNASSPSACRWPCSSPSPASPGEAAVQKWAVFNLRIEIVAQLFYAGFMSFNTLATGAGRTIFVMLNSFANCIVMRVVLALWFESLWGITGVYIACAVAPAISVPIGYWYYRSNRWQRSLAGAAA